VNSLSAAVHPPVGCLPLAAGLHVTMKTLYQRSAVLLLLHWHCSIMSIFLIEIEIEIEIEIDKGCSTVSISITISVVDYRD
jgi:hypothetical protein